MSDLALRFGGIQRLYGVEAVNVFQKSHVCVVGIGGVGSWVAEALARSAIGEITLIDLDDVCVSNINRQIHALDSTVGKMKVSVMAERILQINPECKVHVVEDFITRDNLFEYLSTDMNCVVDAIDSIKPKAALIAHCKRQKIPVITIGGAGGQKDPTQIKVADLNRTSQDPLAAKVRSELRRFYNFSRNPKRRYSVECVHSSEQQVYPKPDGSVCQQKSFEDGTTRLDCASGFGAATVVTATFGFVAVSRVLEKLIKKAASD
ncbi:tRNA cyclic N6-threonylcarbamoyladenosine(37) synthase TcdA [Pleionea sp. CnH1-48]|uniref:tRNA cyclic N6-threonylcarbamoyladenosine(37) synthase TcdA n=1 Tax=Pleionea sp. CnH1-48 TaxID=2954494 RepID=UPI002097F66B|nr:tRNA cyclic N6-threonylcarbamoyladenosine(37) synthase TcdA [Pleionea sp. CnH1-48]MCO7224546.1 tRNA cyclic N6-threonylcarbamoyladenosine(37) synthase TcdA [Pleionea sp. CnH1-48]